MSNQQSTPDQQRKVGWIALPIGLSPAILCLLLGLIAMALPREASDVCATFLSQEILTTISGMGPKLQDVVFPCSVLAVQASVILPLVLFMVFVLVRRSRKLRRVSINIFVTLFLIAGTFVLWMDLFFVGAFYALAAQGSGLRRSLVGWFGGTSFMSLVAVVCAAWVIILIYQRIRSLAGTMAD